MVFGFGIFFSDLNLSITDYFFESILPGYYDFRPSHVHIKITTPNEEVLISQLYFANDPYCENDTWCQDADDRIISLIENEFGLSGEIDLIINSSESGIILENGVGPQPGLPDAGSQGPMGALHHVWRHLWFTTDAHAVCVRAFAFGIGRVDSCVFSQA